MLEKNIDFAAAQAFKQILVSRVFATGAALETCLPFLGSGEGPQLLLHIHALTIGDQHIAEPEPIMKQVIEAGDESAIFNIDFEERMLAAMKALLYGLQHLSRKKPA